MSLSKYAVSAAIAVSDADKAKEFYEGKLGLSNGEDQPDGGTTYTCADGSQIHIYPSPDNAGKSGATLAWWGVDNTEQVVDELSSSGVTFEQYDMEEIKTDDKGIATLGDQTAAWFKDPDGNTLAVGTVA